MARLYLDKMEEEQEQRQEQRDKIFESLEINIYDLKELFGKQRAESFRSMMYQRNLIYLKPMRRKVRNKYGKDTIAILSIAHFKVDEAIEVYKHRVEKAKSGYLSRYIKSFQRTLDDLYKLKEFKLEKVSTKTDG